MISGMQLFVGVGKALVEARVGIESQKARGPRSIVVRVAVTDGVCGRVVMWVRREPFETAKVVCVRQAQSRVGRLQEGSGARVVMSW